MKKKVFSLIMVLFLGACGVLKPSQSPSSKKTNRSQRTKQDLPSTVIIQLIKPSSLELILTEQITNKSEKLLLKKGINSIDLVPGQWKVTGFNRGSLKYSSLNLSTTLLITVKPKVRTYAGSYIVNCPTVGPEFLDQMKKMEFFNRFHFSGHKKLCEMVVGDQRSEVRKLLKPNKKEVQPLWMGF